MRCSLVLAEPCSDTTLGRPLLTDLWVLMRVFAPFSSLNAVKETVGFRTTFNISNSLSDEDHVNDTAQCGSDDDVETSALIVQKQTIILMDDLDVMHQMCIL